MPYIFLIYSEDLANHFQEEKHTFNQTYQQKDQDDNADPEVEYAYNSDEDSVIQSYTDNLGKRA